MTRNYNYSFIKPQSSIVSIVIVNSHIEILNKEVNIAMKNDYVIIHI